MTLQCQRTPSSSASISLHVTYTTAAVFRTRAHTSVIFDTARVLCCRKLAEEGTGQVFMADSVLVALMCAPRSVYSWDVLITKTDGKMYFDTRSGFSINTVTVRTCSTTCQLGVHRYCFHYCWTDMQRCITRTACLSKLCCIPN